jgi:hypothetical protein
MRARIPGYLTPIVLTILLLACKQPASLAGRYVAGNGSDPAAGSITLELLQNGQGTWSTSTDNASFRWNADANHLWLHTPSGGIIQGTIGKDTIRLKLPGLTETLFKRTQIPGS